MIAVYSQIGDFYIVAVIERINQEDVSGIRVGRFNLGINTTFVVYRIGHTIIDAGPGNQWREVKGFLDEQPIRQLLISHHHEDHSGNAARIAGHFNLVPMAPALSRDKLMNGFQIPFWQKLIWGSATPVATVDFPDKVVIDSGFELVPVASPGHAKDLHCFHIPERGWMFTGDLYIARSIRYLRSDENLMQLIQSIQRVLNLDFKTIFCPHRGIVKDGKQALKEKLENILILCEQSQDMSKRGIPIPAIVKHLLGKEDITSIVTGYNFSKRNLIKEALKVNLNTTLA